METRQNYAELIIYGVLSFFGLLGLFGSMWKYGVQEIPFPVGQLRIPAAGMIVVYTLIALLGIIQFIRAYRRKEDEL